MNLAKRPLLAVLSIWFVAFSGLGASSYSPNIWVNENLLAAPKAGSFKSDYAHFGLSSESLALGSVVIPFPLDLYKERGAALHEILPSYSHRGSLSEWGKGWDVALSIHRYSDVGEVDCNANDFVSPWGKLQLSSARDAYYPKGLEVDVRIVRTLFGFIAYHPDGRVFRFGGEHVFGNEHARFAWYLNDVVDKEGHTTALFYKKNEFGRPILQKVLYGGKKTRQYEVEFVYADLLQPIKSYESCDLESTISQRVKAVSLRNWNGEKLVLAKTVHLNHDFVNRGAVFQLAKVSTEFASGERLPEVKFHYEGYEKFLEKPFKQINNGFFELLPKLKNRGFFGTTLAFVDINQDGLIDIERGDNLQSFIQNSSGNFSAHANHMSVSRDARCPPTGPFNEFLSYGYPRRLLIRPAGIDDTLQHLLFSNQKEPHGTLTKIIVCSLDGKVNYEKQIYNGLDSGFSFKDFTHLADLNGDAKPDLVRVAHGRYTYFLNESTKSEIKFADAQTRRLPKVNDRYTKNFNFTDINGDRFVDLVAQVKGGIFVWFGKGDNTFGPEEHYFRFQTDIAAAVDLSKAELTFIDVNRDGMMDVVLHRWHNAFVFINQGNRFFYEPSASLINRPEFSSYPRVVNISGGVDDQLTMYGGQRGLISYDLNGASTGLLIRIENGHGVIVDLDYQWTKPQVGVRRSFVVPKSQSLTVPGRGTKTTRFEFLEPQVHPLNGQLIGFTRVEARDEQLETKSDYLVNAQHPPKMSQVAKKDLRGSHLEQVENREWQESELGGVFYLKLVKVINAVVSQGLRIPQRTLEHLAYERLCPTSTRETTELGQNDWLVSYFAATALSHHHGCLKATETVVGRHKERSDFDFTYSNSIVRNDAGLPLELHLLSANEKVTKTKLAYDDSLNVRKVDESHTGEYSLEYDPIFEILKSLESPDGSRQSVTQYSAQSDRMSGLLIENGAFGSWIQGFDYDGHDRLHKTWNNVTNTSEASPLSEYSYRFANETAPALITEHSKSGQGGVSDSYRLSTADGEEILAARENVAGFSFGRLLRKTLGTGEHQEIEVATNQDPAHLSFATLSAYETQISTTTMGLWGMLARRVAVDATHVNNVTHSYQLEPKGLTTISLENERFTSSSLSALSDGESVAYHDERGREFKYARDLLGRVREVQLPDGSSHRIDFDGFGRVSKIVRSGVGEVHYIYDNDSNRLVEKVFRNVDGVALRQEAYVYDDAGRMRSRTFANDLQKEIYELGYEGAYLKEVNHKEFAKKLRYAADGLVLEKQFVSTQGAAVVLNLEYDELRRASNQRVLFSDGHGTKKSYEKHFTYDRYQQLESVSVAEQRFGIVRNKHGKVDAVTLPNGNALYVEYDSLTQGRKGYRLVDSSDGGELASYRWGFDDRGLIAKIDFVTPASSHTFDYDYAADKSLKSTKLHDDVTVELEYPTGPNGRISRFATANGSVSYVYDENRHRVAKYRDGTLESIRFEGVIVSKGQVYEKLTIDNVDVGILVDGRFHFAMFDQVGSLLSFDDVYLTSDPFGNRELVAPIQEHFDFTGQGRDLDTGLIGMGERDYDPRLRRFISPDLFYLQSPEECVRSPQECDLYSYAKNNPLLYTDPSGGYAESALDVVCISYSLAEYTLDKSWVNAAALGLDTLGLALPGVVGLGRGFKALLKASDAVQAFDRATEVVKGFDKAADAAGSAGKLRYEAAPYHGKVGNPLKSKAPTNAAEALELSFPLKSTTSRRIGIDIAEKEFVVFSKTENGLFHGHVRAWNDLRSEMQNALKKAGLVNNRGKILGGK